jgi:dipeptidyl aminopeptidase/acylaminoacyl peptidase
MVIYDISADHSQILVGTAEESGSGETPLWSVPVPAGSPRRLGDILGGTGSWSRDGQQLVFTKGPALYVAKADGSAPHLLVSVTGVPFAPRFSPDGKRIRFTVQSAANTNALWEVRTDGSNLHQLFAGWHNPPNECCGRWTEDGRYYVFDGTTADDPAGTQSNIFALAESTHFSRKASVTPVQLTTGPVQYFWPTPDVAGHKLFAQGVQPRAELVRYDSASKQFVPFLQGISATDVDFSRDGKWITYVSVPDLALWRSRVDGSERLQLAPVAALPRWSPDGRQIAYHAAEFGKPWKIFVVSAEGGPAQELLQENTAEMDVTWSADGTQLAFGRLSYMDTANAQLYVADIKTRTVSPIPDSKGLYSPRWSPDGRYLSAVSVEASRRLMLYDFHSQKWSEWSTENDNFDYGQWSANGKYFYWENFGTNPKCRRIKLGEHRVEDLFSLNSLRRYFGVFGSWSGQAPDDSRVFVRDVSTQHIYALDVAFP